MGPQHVLAELFRPPRIDTASALRTPVEKFSSEFRRHLDDAASTASRVDRESSTRPADKKATEKPRDKARAKSSDESTDTTETTKPDATASQANAVVAIQTDDANGDDAVVAGDSAAQLKAAAEVAGESSTEDVSESSGTTDTAHPAAATLRTLDASDTTSQKAALTSAIQSSIQNNAGDTETTLQNAVADAQNSTANTSAEASPESEQIVRTIPVETLLQAKSNVKENSGVIATGAKASKRSAADGDDAKAAVGTQTVSSRQSAREAGNASDASGGQSIQERKAAISVEQSNAGGVKNSKPNGKLKIDAKNMSGINGNTRTNLNGAGSAVRDVGPIQVQSGEGDDSAATIARFLVNGARDDAATSSNSQNGSHVSAGTSSLSNLTANHAKTGTATSFSATVDNLIQSRAETSDQMGNAVRVMQAGKGGGQYNVTMQLDPPELGPMKLNIQMRNSNMTLQVDAQTRDVAKLVESHLTELRDVLATHGISIDRAQVIVRSPDTGATSHQQQQDQPTARHNDGGSYDGRHSSHGFDESAHQSGAHDRPSWSQHSSDDFQFDNDNEFQKPEIIEQIGTYATSIAERSVNLIA